MKFPFFLGAQLRGATQFSRLQWFPLFNVIPVYGKSLASFSATVIVSVTISTTVKITVTIYVYQRLQFLIDCVGIASFPHPLSCL